MSEVWRDREALATHLADDEFQATMKEFAGVEIVARNVQKYEVLRQPIFRPALPADHLCEHMPERRRHTGGRN